MNTKTTLIFLIFAIASFGAYLMIPATPTPTGRSAGGSSVESNGRPLLPKAIFQSNQITQIDWVAPGEPSVTLKRLADQPDQWQQTSPVTFPLNNWPVQSLLAYLEQLRYTNELSTSDDSLGLSPTQSPRLVLSGPDLSPITLQLGRAAGAGTAYLQHTSNNEAKIYIVNHELHDFLNRHTIKTMRPKLIQQIDAGQIQRVTFTQGDARYLFERVAGRWHVQQPLTGLANTATVESLIALLTASTVDHYIADQPADLADYGLTTPTWQLVIEQVKADTTQASNDPTAPLPTKLVKHTLELGDPTDLQNTHFYARYNNQPVVFTLVRSDLMAAVSLKQDNLLSPQLTPFLEDDTQTIHLAIADRPDDAVALHRQNGHWTWQDPSITYRLDRQKLREWLDLIFETTGDSFSPINQFPQLAQQKPTLTINLTQLGTQSTNQLKLYPYPFNTEQPTQWLVHADQKNFVQLLPYKTMHPLTEGRLGLRDHLVKAFDLNQLSEVTFTRTGFYPAQYTLKRSPTGTTNHAGQLGPWQTEGFDHIKFGQVIAMLNPLIANRWLSHSSLDPSLGHTMATLRLTDRHGTAHELQVDLTDRQAFMPGIADRCFTPHPNLIKVLAREWREQKLVPHTIDDLARIERGDLIVHRTRNGLYRLPNGQSPASEPATAALFNAISHLSAEYFIAPTSPLLESITPATPALTTIQWRSHDDQTGTIAILSHVKKLGISIARVNDQFVAIKQADAQKLMAATTAKRR